MDGLSWSSVADPVLFPCGILKYICLFGIVQMREELSGGEIPSHVKMAFKLAAKDQRYANLFVPVIKEHVARLGINADVSKVSFAVLQKY